MIDNLYLTRKTNFVGFIGHFFCRQMCKSLPGPIKILGFQNIVLLGTLCKVLLDIWTYENV